MAKLVNSLRSMIAECRAASATEYALMAGILAAGLVGAFAGLTDRLHVMINGLSF